MRTLFVSQELPPETGWGGIGTYVDVLSEALARRGVEVHVLSVVEGQSTSTTDVRGVTVHRRPLPRVRGSARLPPESWRRSLLPLSVARLIARLALEPDVIECPEWSAEGLALALRGASPLVVRLHSSARQLFPYTGQGTRLRGLDGKWLVEGTTYVSIRSCLKALQPDDVARLTFDGIEALVVESRLPELRHRLRTVISVAQQEAPRVTFVGRLEPRKAPEVVLRAAPKVLAAMPDARFTFVGRDAIADGAPPSTAWLREEAARLGVAHAVELTGQLDRTGVEEQLRRATVCAFPSRWESFGNVLAEAAATGRPVVASPIPPFRELVDDGVTGRLAPLDDEQAWADALLEVLGDSERASAMGRAGAGRIAAISSPARVADLALAAHEHAIERWRRGARAAGR